MSNSIITPAEQAILDELKITNPEAYNAIYTIQNRYIENVKLGCHELGNIISLISSTYQLMDFMNPSYRNDNYWNQLGSDITGLSSCIKAISKYRYAHNVSLKECTIKNLCQIYIQM